MYGVERVLRVVVGRLERFAELSRLFTSVYGVLKSSCFECSVSACGAVRWLSRTGPGRRLWKEEEMEMDTCRPVRAYASAKVVVP